MTHWYCYECINGRGECNAPCEYIDPIGEMYEAPIKCTIGNAKWVRGKCECCGQVV